MLEEDHVQDNSRRSMASIIKNVKIEMKNVWGNAQRFGVSNEVFMVEVEVIHRLLTDGVM